MTPTDWKTANLRVRTDLAAWYRQFDEHLSTRGQRVLARAENKGKLNGENAVRYLTEPGFLVGPFASTAQLAQLVSICRTVPFSGNYSYWEPFRALLSMAYRTAVQEHDTELADAAQCWLSYPNNDEAPGVPVIHEAMRNRLDGLLIDGFRTPYTRPLKLPEFTYSVAKIRELYVIWAFGGSPKWPRTRIDDELESSYQLLADYLEPEVK